MNRRYPGSRKPVVKSTKRGGADDTCVPNRILGCLPPRSGCGCAATSCPRKAFSLPVEIRVSHPARAVSNACTILFVCHVVAAEILMRGAHATCTSSRSSSDLSSFWRSSSTRSHLLLTITSARPASTTCCTTRTSCSVNTSEASKRTRATSAFSIAACVLIDA